LKKVNYLEAKRCLKFLAKKEEKMNSELNSKRIEAP
jgi:hypothetical protein